MACVDCEDKSMSNAEHLRWAVYSGPRSASLAPLPWLDDSARLSVLSWCMARLSRAFCVSTVGLIQAGRLNQIGNNPENEQNIVEIGDPHIGKALLAVAERFRIENILLASVETGLLPTKTLNTFISAHCRRGAAITRAASLPKGIELYGFSRAYLEALQKRFGMNFPFHPGRGSQVQSFISEQQASLPDRQIHFVFQDVLLRPPPHMSWPDLVDLSTPGGISRLRSSLSNVEQDDLLAAWDAEERTEKKSIFRNTNRRRNSSRAQKGTQKHVLVVSNACGYSGAEGSLLELLSHLNPDRYKVTVLLTLEGYLSRSLTPYVDRCIIYGDDFTSFSAATMLRLREIFHDVRPDLVHFNSNEGLPCISLCLALGIPYVQHIRNGELRGFRRTVEGADAIVAVSKYLADKVSRLGPATDRIKVIYDEVDCQYFAPDKDRKQAREELELDASAPTVLMVARFVPNKRHDVLIAAMALLMKRLPKVKLLLKGDNYGPDSSYSSVLMLLETSGVAQVTTHIQFVNDIRRLYVAADVLVLCSDDEGLGRCVVEAMSMALPVVVTNTGGTHEIVDDGVSGLVVPGNDPIALEGALFAILGDAEKREVMGAAGRQIALSQLSASKSALEVMGLYEAIWGDESSAS